MEKFAYAGSPVDRFNAVVKELDTLVKDIREQAERFKFLRDKLSTSEADQLMKKLNTLVKDIDEQIEEAKFLRDELLASEPTRNWREADGVIYFSVTSDGMTGPQWIERLEGKGFSISDDARGILRNEGFKPTNGVTTEVAVLKGVLFEGNRSIMKNARTEAANRSLEAPNTEIACLIGEKFTNEEVKAMGLICIVAMHEPIKDSYGYPCLLLCVDRCHDDLLLCTRNLFDGVMWARKSGFAFAVPQVSAQQ